MLDGERNDEALEREYTVERFIILALVRKVYGNDTIKKIV